MAAFVVGLGMAPSEYKQLTVIEREALIRAQKQANRKR